MGRIRTDDMTRAYKKGRFCENLFSARQTERRDSLRGITRCVDRNVLCFRASFGHLYVRYIRQIHLIGINEIAARIVFGDIHIV